MMPCKKIQELLKTDYLDQETSIQQDRLIKEHLKQCPSCSMLEKKLRVARQFLQEAKDQPVPEHIWSNIRQAIAAERLKEQEGVFPGLLERLKNLVLWPKPRVVLAASFLSVVIISAVFVNVSLQQQSILAKQNAAERIAGYSLSDKNGYVLHDLGTSIEKYFL